MRLKPPRRWATDMLKSAELNDNDASLNGQLDDLRIARAAHPENADIAAKLAQLYADKGWFNEAIEIYKTIIGPDETNYPLLLEYANVCFRKQETDEAVRIFKKLTVLKPLRMEGWNNLGIVQHALHQDDAALESFKKVLDLEPDNAGALLNIGNCHATKKDTVRAQEFFLKAVKARPDFADAWFNLGNAYSSAKDYTKAIDAFEKALRYQREFPSALKNIGFAYEQSGDIDAALTYYRKALELSKGDSALYVNLANACVVQGKFEEAKAYYLQSVKLTPKNIAGWMGLRHLALIKGDIAGYTKSTLAVIGRLSSEAVAESLMVLRELGHFGDIDELLCKADAAGLCGDDIDAERLLAYQRTDSYPGKILAIAQRLKELSAPTGHIRACLARYAFDIGEFAAALGYLEPPCTERIDVNKLLWQTCIALKQLEKAQRLIREYLDRHNDSFDAWYYLAQIKAQGGEAEAAREFLLKALELGFSDMELLQHDAAMKQIFETLKTNPRDVLKPLP